MIHQCAALKPDGKQCQRVAKPGSNYCHSHRDHVLQVDKSELKRLPDLDIFFSREHLLCVCSDSGRIIKDHMVIPYRLADTEGTVLGLCCRCFQLRKRIEKRIVEICACPGGLPAETVYEDLAHFGVPQDLVEATRLRMLKDGRLVST